ncbi:MAG: hypothetical protein ACLQM8_15275, partial [Limisphaerales bacterium]
MNIQTDLKVLFKQGQFFFWAQDRNSPTGSTREALRACLRRQRRHSYQPRATPWVYRPKAILSAEGA